MHFGSENQGPPSAPPRGTTPPAAKPPAPPAARPPAPKAPAGVAKPVSAPPATPGTITPAAAPTADGLEATPVLLEALGLRFRPPANTVMRAEGAGLNATWILSERADPPRFILRISRLVASAPESSPAQQMDDLVRSATEKPAADTVFAVRARREFTVEGQPAGLLYTTLREGSGEEEVTATQGYLLVQTGTNEFIVISSLIAEQDFEAMRKLLDRCWATIDLVTADELLQSRAERMEAGARLLAGFDEATLRRALDPAPSKGTPPAPRWFRVSRHLADGTVQEAGYLTMTVVEGTQGDANPDRTPKEWTADEREKGLLVRLQARTLVDEKGATVSDTETRMWVRWDRAREFWTVRTTLRRGRSSRTSSLLGFRNPPSATSPKGVIQVAEVDLLKPASEPRQWPVPPVAYLSQAESYVLPRLLPAGDARGEWGFYWYDPRSGRLAQRIDRRSPAKGGAMLATQPTVEAPAMEQLLDAQGHLLRRETDDGTVIESIAPAELLDLWRRKGLPTG